MKNKGFLIFLILVIFCAGVTIGSVSATNLDTNSSFSDDNNTFETTTQNECILSSEDNHDSLQVNKNPLQQEITITSKNRYDYNYTGRLWIDLSQVTNSIYYEVTDENGNEVHYEHLTHYIYAKGTCSFSSNHDIFRDLPDGTYHCKITVPDYKSEGISVLGTSYEWDVVKYTDSYMDSYADEDYQISEPVKKPKTTTVKKSRPVKYIKVGKYKIKVWADDSLNTRKNKVIKYLNKHVKKPHTFKIKGYKFKVSAKMYRKILYYKKFGYDGKVGYSNFKVKTNKVIKYKMPIFETRKYTKYVWKYIKVLSGSSRWGDGWSDYTPYDNSKYYRNGWKYYGSYNVYYSQGTDTYSKLKKKVKTTVTEDVKVGYKTVKLRVYAWGVETHLNVGVQFRGTGQGYKNLPLTSYYMF